MKSENNFKLFVKTSQQYQIVKLSLRTSKEGEEQVDEAVTNT